MAVIGIDLGTTNSLAAVWQGGQVCLIPDKTGNYITPSIVAVDADGNIMTGYAAREEELLAPDRCASNFKRFMGTEKRYCLAGHEFRPEELSALLLKKMKEGAEAFLGEEVTEAVISVPAYFNSDQRYATKLAAQLAGLACERIVNEPSAAALTVRQEELSAKGQEGEAAFYTMDSGEASEQCLLVFDFGGGTLDVSIVDCFENIVEITAIAGDNHLGGTDFDEAIAAAFCAENGMEWETLDRKEKTALMFEGRRCKETLSSQEAVTMQYQRDAKCLGMELTSEKIFSLAPGLFRRIKNTISRALSDAGLGISDISQVLLAGGSSRMPAVQMFLSRLFGRGITAGVEPDFLVARGIGIYAGIKERQEEVKDILMTDVCPFSLGLRVQGDLADGEGKMCMMIERNNILPCRVTKYFVTASEFQEEIRLMVYQGESYHPEQNLKIGELCFPVPKAPAGKEGVYVTFTYNINGILEVFAASSSTGQEKSAAFVSGRGQFSPEQLLQKQDWIQAQQHLLQEEEERKAILSMADRLFAETSGAAREYVEQVIQYYNHAWKSKSLIRIRKAGKAVLQSLLAVDMRLRQSMFDEGMFEEAFLWEDGAEE